MTQLDLKHDYRVLDVPSDASPRTIKTNYRKLIKRWHPDRYRPGSDAATDSNLMTKLINESYARIKNAPLQSAVADAASNEIARGSDLWEGPDGSDTSGREYDSPDPNHGVAEFYRVLERARQAEAHSDALRPLDWFGFAVRFVCGALLGAFLSFSVIIRLYDAQPEIIYVSVVASVITCGLASGFGGDAFWRSIRPGGIWSWWRW